MGRDPSDLANNGRMEISQIERTGSESQSALVSSSRSVDVKDFIDADGPFFTQTVTVEVVVGTDTTGIDRLQVEVRGGFSPAFNATVIGGSNLQPGGTIVNVDPAGDRIRWELGPPPFPTDPLVFTVKLNIKKLIAANITFKPGAGVNVIKPPKGSPIDVPNGSGVTVSDSTVTAEFSAAGPLVDWSGSFGRTQSVNFEPFLSRLKALRRFAAIT